MTKNFEEFITEKTEAIKAEAKKIVDQTLSSIKSSANSISTNLPYRENWLLDEVIKMLEESKKK